MAEEDTKSMFKKQSIIFIIIKGILIISTLVLYIIRETEIEDLENLSMDKLYIMAFIVTILFAIFVSGYLLNGVFKYNMISKNFASKIVNKINYEIIMKIVLIIVIIGVICFFIDLTVVRIAGDDLMDLTWGGIIAGIAGLIILGITMLIGILLLISEIKVVS